MSSSQADLLTALRQRFPRQALLLDTEARFQAFKMASSGYDLKVAHLPDHVKDPAELTTDEVFDLALYVTR